MQEKSLLKTAIIFSLIGITILYIISNETEVDEAILAGMKSSDAPDSAVSVKGDVLRVTNFTNSKIVEIQKKERLSIVVIGQEYLDINKGDVIEAVGKFQNDNKGALSLIASEIRKIYPVKDKFYFN